MIYAFFTELLLRNFLPWNSFCVQTVYKDKLCAGCACASACVRKRDKEREMFFLPLFSEEFHIGLGLFTHPHSFVMDRLSQAQTCSSAPPELKHNVSHGENKGETNRETPGNQGWRRARGRRGGEEELNRLQDADSPLPARRTWTVSPAP